MSRETQKKKLKEIERKDWKKRKRKRKGESLRVCRKTTGKQQRTTGKRANKIKRRGEGESEGEGEEGSNSRWQGAAAAALTSFGDSVCLSSLPPSFFSSL